MLALADRFGFLLLKNALGAVLAKKVSAQNALKLLPAADAYCIDALREKCLEQLDKTSSSILSSEEFESLDPLLVKMIVSRETFDAPEVEIFECLIKIIKKLGMESSEALDFLLTCINLSSMNTKDMFSRVEPTGYFTETVILQGVRALTQNDLNLIRGRGVKGREFIDGTGKVSTSPQALIPVTIEYPLECINSYICRTLYQFNTTMHQHHLLANLSL